MGLHKRVSSLHAKGITTGLHNLTPVNNAMSGAYLQAFQLLLRLAESLLPAGHHLPQALHLAAGSFQRLLAICQLLLDLNHLDSSIFQ